MASRDRCPHCGALILPDEKFCAQCGGPLVEADGVAEEAAPAWGNIVEEATPAREDVGAEPAGEWESAGRASGWLPGTRPCTIEQLRDFCAYNEMPLERMRFFVGEDYKEARAFGIYREDDRFVVYKNKADGSRAVRYNGPDEARAVGELYDKLLDECHKRDIWPDGKPEGLDKRRKADKRRMLLIAVLMALIMAVGAFIFMRLDARRHAHDGYYRFGDEGIYFCYGEDWYYDDDYYDWVLLDSGPYDDYDDWSDYYLGQDYDDGWGYSDFTSSEAWDRIQEENRTSASDYDSWDTGDTDWDSDW